MKSTAALLYSLILSLWTGGVALFTFVVTPAIFRSYGRDMAGEIVNRIFPGYFHYTLIVSGVAFIFFFLAGGDRSKIGWRVSLFLLAAAFAVNSYITFSLHPEAVRARQAVSSFERESPDSPARRHFSRVHAVSASLNLFILADAVVLLVLNRLPGKR